MKKIISIILTIIITSISFTQIAYADESFGTIRYDVTDLNVEGTNITFKGWAFIRRTHNFSTTKNDIPVIWQNSNLKNSAGEQKIAMRAVLKNSDGTYSQIGEIHYYDYGTDNRKYKKNYDFYQEHKYLGSTDNSCNSTTADSNCLYEDIYFEFTFDVSTFVVSEKTNIYFQIAIHNKDFQEKVNKKNMNSKTGTTKLENQLYTGWETIGVTDKATTNISNSDNIEKGTISTKVKALVVQGMIRRLNDLKTMKINNYSRWIETGSDYTIYNYNEGSFIKGYMAPENSSGYYNSGYYALCGGNYDYNYMFPGDCDGKNEFAVSAAWVKPSSEFFIQVKNDKKCPLVNPSKGDLYCNDNLTLKAECSELTVKKNGSRANVKISQTGTISSVLTPNKIYAGGGFNLGIIYYNTISWSCVNGYTCDGNIKSAMNDKLKSKFQDSIKLKDIKFNGKIIDSSQFIKKCKGTGSFTDGKTLTTVCTFFLPKSTIDKDGKVKYGVGNDLGINNKYYTSLDDKNPYNIELTITGMDRLTENSTENDSKEKNKSWTGSWEKKFNNCSIKVYSLLAEPTTSKTLKYKPIYRPIDLNNPFPDRNAGVNWYEWYSKDSNKKRLQESYSKLQYQVTLDNQTVAKIKDYNTNYNYLEWDNIENGESKFIDEYFNTKRQNIVGDDS